MQQVYEDAVDIGTQLNFPYYTKHSKENLGRLDKVNNILENNYTKMVKNGELDGKTKKYCTDGIIMIQYGPK